MGADDPGLPSGFSSLGQACFVVLGQQRVAADVDQVQTNQVLVRELVTLAGQEPSSLSEVLRED